MNDFFFYIEIVAAVLGFIYVTLEVLQKRLMWVMNFFTAICFVAVYVHQGLYAMMSLQFYYIVLSVVSFIQWGRSAKSGIAVKGDKSMGYSVGDEDKDVVLLIRKMSPKVAILSLIAATAVFFALGYVFKIFTDNPRPYLDSLIATLSMLATYWLSKKYIEQWYVWVVCNVIGIFLYFTLRMYPTAILYIVYLIMCGYGIYHWRKKGITI